MKTFILCLLLCFSVISVSEVAAQNFDFPGLDSGGGPSENIDTGNGIDGFSDPVQDATDPGFQQPRSGNSECYGNRECIEDKQDDVQDKAPKLPSGGILPGGGEKAVGVTEIRGHVANTLFPRSINFTLIVTISASVLLIIIGGIFYIASMGESEKTGKAKEIITWAIIGLVISSLAFTFIRIITGIDFIK